MKLLDQVKAIVESYNLRPIVLSEQYKNIYEYINEHYKDKELTKARIEEFTNKEITDDYLCAKYQNHIEPNHYGFDIGTPIVPAWMNVLDEVVGLCVKNDSDFSFTQIKLKFGGIRFYASSILIEDIDEICSYIENILFDKKLVY